MLLMLEAAMQRRVKDCRARRRSRWRAVGIVVCLLLAAVVGSSQAEEGEAPRLDEPRATDLISYGLVMPFAHWMGTPADIGAPYREVWIDNPFGNRLNGWLLDREGTDRTVLICMGNTGNMSHMLPYAKALFDAGFDVLMFDYQGFGKSEGRASILTIAGDAYAAWRYLREDLGRRAEDTGILGVSLGSVLALMVARLEMPAAVAVENVFRPDKIIAMTSDQFRKNPLVRGALWLLDWTILPGVDPDTNLARIECPVMLVHGVTDWLLPPRTTLEVAGSAGGPTRVWMIDGVGHAPEPLVSVDREYAHQVSTFFRQAMGQSVAPFVELTARFEIVEGEGKSTVARVAVDPKPTGHRPLSITLADGDGRFHFTRLYSDAPADRWLVRPGFAPERAAVIEYGHVVDGGDGTWTPSHSPLGMSYRRYLQHRRESRKALGQLQDIRVLRHMGKARPYFLWTPREWAWLVENIPSVEDLHPRIRPRFARQIGEAVLGLGGDECLAAVALLVRYLPDDPRTHFMLGNASFTLGFEDFYIARACLKGARLRAARGELEAARELARLYVELFPDGQKAGITRAQVDAIASAADLRIDGVED